MLGAFRKFYERITSNSESWVQKEINSVDLVKEIEWAKEYVETYHLEDPMEPSFIAYCIDSKKKKSTKIQKMLELNGENLFDLGFSAVKKGLYPYMYLACSQMLIMEKETDEDGNWAARFGIHDHPFRDLPEKYFCIVMSIDGTRVEAAMADIIRDGYGNKIGVGEWDNFDDEVFSDGSWDEQEAVKFWEGAASAASSMRIES